MHNIETDNSVSLVAGKIMGSNWTATWEVGCKKEQESHLFL